MGLHVHKVRHRYRASGEFSKPHPLPTQMKPRQDRAVHVEMIAHSERSKSNEEQSSTLTALMVDSNYVLDSHSE